MIEKLFELDEFTLYPSVLNTGIIQKEKYNFGILDEADMSTSLPIFTSSSDTIINKKNWNEFAKVGIRPILPIVEDLQIRLEGCQYLFASFTTQELRNFFLNQQQRGSGIFRIYIDNNGNGHDVEVLNVANELRKAYGPRIEIMAGNIINPKTYIEYCKAGIDYVRVGMGELNIEENGFYYPLGSLLVDILGTKATACVGLKQTKIIADGGVMTNPQILKALAVGADYVLLDRPLARLVEAASGIYKTEKDAEGHTQRIEVNKGTVASLSEADIKSMNLARMFSKSPTKGEWVPVNATLSGWLKDLYDTFGLGFSMTGSLTWKDFKANVKYGGIQQ